MRRGVITLGSGEDTSEATCGRCGGIEVELLKEKELAAKLQVNIRTLQRWRQDKRIPFYTLPNGHIRYVAEVVSNWLARGCPMPR